jgi:adenylate cyclase
MHVRGDLHQGWLERLELASYDVRTWLTMPRTMDDRVVIVDVDERSLLQQGQWPWPRNTLAELVDRLFDRYQIALLGFDMVFAEPDASTGLGTLQGWAEGPLADDPRFLETLRQSRAGLDFDGILARSFAGRPVVLGYIFRREGDPGAQIKVGALPPPIVPPEKNDLAIPFHEALGYTGNLPELQRSARTAGFFENPTVDADGVYRRVPMVQAHRDGLYPSLGLAVAMTALGSPSVDFEFFSGPEGPRDGLDLEGLRLGSQRIPLGARATMLVPYRGPQGSFPYVSATDVFEGRAPNYPLKNAIVLLGTSAPGLNDLRSTPVGERFNGVEIHANVISGLLDGRLKSQPYYFLGLELILLVILAIGLTLLLSLAPVGLGMFGCLVVFLALFLANVWAFSRGWVIPLAASEVLVAGLFVAHTAYGYFVESRGRRALSTLFGQYVPPELVREMASNPRHFGMQTVSREMTVLFADVRGFTRIAEDLEPTELSLLMNEFLTVMTRVIHRHRGTIDKYMGDAVMAFWGAPLPDPDHARNALTAAFEMQGAMQSLLPSFRIRGWPELAVGIGLNSGQMRVGNMGSEFRVAYTVLGDAVNLGARIESLTREYGVTVAVGQQTRDALADIGFLELDLVRVRGKGRPVAIFEPLGPKAELDNETLAMCKRHERALHLYRTKEWDDAEREFYLLHQSHPARQIFRVYLDRIAHCRNEPPGPDWDGVFTQSVK